MGANSFMGYIISQWQKEFERLVEGKRILIEYIKNRAHGGQALRVAGNLIGMPERINQRFCAQMGWESGNRLLSG